MGLSQDYADLARIWAILGLFQAYPGPWAQGPDIGKYRYLGLFAYIRPTGPRLDIGYIGLYTGIQAHIQGYRLIPLYRPYTLI